MSDFEDDIEKKKLLVIAYSFPPIPYSGTYRIIRALKGLDSLGTEIHALTINIDKKIPNDDELLDSIPAGVKVHRTKIIDPWLYYNAWKQKQKLNSKFTVINKIISLLIRFITIPDHQIFWIPFAVHSAKGIIKKYKISTIMVSSPPNSSQLIGYLLKKQTNVKWLADLRDPIVGNVAQVNLIKSKDIMSKIEKCILRILENKVLENADNIIANTETHRNELIQKFGLTNCVTIRNSFDNDDYNYSETKNNEKFTISHLGGMYGLRKADVLFAAIKKLENMLAPDPLMLQVIFVGLNDPSLKETVARYHVENFVNIFPLVPHKKAIEIMINSHLLLLIKATGEGSLGQIPAKFFEYIGTKNKVIFLGPSMSEVGVIIKKLNAGYVIENNEDEMFSVLYNEYNKYLNGSLEKMNESHIEKFNLYEMAKKINQLID